MAEHSQDPASATASTPAAALVTAPAVDPASALGSTPEDVGVSIHDIVSEPEDPSVQAAIMSDIIANMPNIACTQRAVPVITVPFASSKAKGKAKITDPDEPPVAPVPAPTVKRKLNLSEDIEFVHETRPSKRSEHRLTGLALRTRSRTGMSTPAPPPASAPASKPAASSKTRASKVSKETLFKPILLSPSLETIWQLHCSRDILVENNFSIEYLIRTCNIIHLLHAQNLLQTIQNVGAYFAWLISEFYANIQSDSLLTASPHYHRVFLRDVWYDFSPAIINA
ncbi:PREDICTED: uncharacterized protein LOC109149939 [Ipomoea nil]|uniref:uncharacterized protein LOC109149939 n=1 Tax=Ipomoea nil TaxID=35883 RepID=UPI000900AA40|nr:PREDICTED: uncharacterized protein LOC109149939 [Ipomoea nil]